jgi:hypothetical protein
MQPDLIRIRQSHRRSKSRLRLRPFSFIQTADGPTAPSPNQAQTKEILPETQARSASGEPTGAGQVAVEEAGVGRGIALRKRCQGGDT